MASWRYLLLDSSTRKPLAELPLMACRFGDVLNDRGSFSVSMPLDDLEGTGITLDLIDPPKAIVVAEREGVPVYAGWVWTWDIDVTTSTLTLNGEGWMSYLGRLVFSANAVYEPTGQNDLLWSVLATADGTALGVGINYEAVPEGGPLRSGTIEAGRTVEETIRGWLGSDVDLGIDLAWLPRWEDDAGEQVLVMDPYVHPDGGLGRDSELTLSLGENAEILAIQGDGSRKAFRFLATASGAGQAALQYTVEDAALIAASRIIMASENYTDISDFSVLGALAEYQLKLRRLTVITPSVRVSEEMFGTFVVGDRILVQGDIGGGFLTVDDTYRIVAWEAAMDDGDETLITLTLVPEGHF